MRGKGAMRLSSAPCTSWSDPRIGAVVRDTMLQAVPKPHLRPVCGLILQADASDIDEVNRAIRISLPKQVQIASGALEHSGSADHGRGHVPTAGNMIRD